ncbi:MAG: Sir2 family transcriptional regulator [Burkholderiaceae bacterium]|nr:Sir2 family transcriptional regulator [Burkholderiaceae bacterium]
MRLPCAGRERTAFEDIASPSAFEKHPATAWGFYGHRLNLYRATTAHAGFELLQGWGHRMPQGCCVFISNVDGHFHKADFAPACIYECHGSIHRLQSTTPCNDHLWPTGNLRPHLDGAACEWTGELPHGPDCGALTRPNILMFDDWHWNYQRSDAQRMLLNRWLDSAEAPLGIEIGAGRSVATVRHFTQRMQQRSSAAAS